MGGLSARRFVIAGGLLLLVIGTVGLWRALHPPLSPEEQIKWNTDDLRVRIENRDTRGVTSYFTDDFTYNGSSRKELVQYMKMAFFQGRDVQIHISNEQVKVEGESATSTGHYSIAFRPGPDAPSETHAGDFQLYWMHQDGTWKVSSLKGGIDLGSG